MLGRVVGREVPVKDSSGGVRTQETGGGTWLTRGQQEDVGHVAWPPGWHNGGRSRGQRRKPLPSLNLIVRDKQAGVLHLLFKELWAQRYRPIGNSHACSKTWLNTLVNQAFPHFQLVSNCCQPILMLFKAFPKEMGGFKCPALRCLLLSLHEKVRWKIGVDTPDPRLAEPLKNSPEKHGNFFSYMWQRVNTSRVTWPKMM